MANFLLDVSTDIIENGIDSEVNSESDEDKDTDLPETSNLLAVPEPIRKTSRFAVTKVNTASAVTLQVEPVQVSSKCELASMSIVMILAMMSRIWSII